MTSSTSSTGFFSQSNRSNNPGYDAISTPQKTKEPSMIDTAKDKAPTGEAKRDRLEGMEVGGSQSFLKFKTYSFKGVNAEASPASPSPNGWSNASGYQFEQEKDGLVRENMASTDTNNTNRLRTSFWPISTTRMMLHGIVEAKKNVKLERNAVGFGLKMATMLTISSMFVFFQFQEGMWVLITVLFVCWFPRLDSASVVEKSIQRLIGTFIGAALALSCGFFSLWWFDIFAMSNEVTETVTDVDGVMVTTDVPPPNADTVRFYQAMFLSVCIFVVTSIVGFSILQFKINGTPIIQRYNYASILCLLTFAIGIFPFYYEGTAPKWQHALYRVQNVIIGCILGAVGSMVVLPRSTTEILTEQINKQIKLAGEASEAVLFAAADSFAGVLECIDLAHELLETKEQKTERLEKQLQNSCRAASYEQCEIVLEKYESALKDWRVTKGVFSILAYDPFNFGVPEYQQKAFKAESANTLARALRIQTTIVLMDGIIRNNPKHNFDDYDIELFADSGNLIRRMLTVPLNVTESEEAACELTEKLHEVRQMIVNNSARVAGSPNELPRMNSVDSFSMLVNNEQTVGNHDHHGKGVPTFVKGSNVCALLFLQLVEHLILRSLRLYSSWKTVTQIFAERKK